MSCVRFTRGFFSVLLFGCQREPPSVRVGRVHPAAGLLPPLLSPLPIHLLSSDRQTEKQTTSKAITLPAEKEEGGENGRRWENKEQEGAP